MTPLVNRALWIALALAVPAGARSDDPENPLPPVRASKHAAKPDRPQAVAVASPASGKGVRPLPAPPHDRELAPAPGHVAPQAPVPARPETGTLALVGATVHTVSGETLAAATVIVEGGKIRAVGRDVAVPTGARTIALAGLHLYPSLISADTVLGLTEIGAVRATQDIVEVGDINPNARAEVAVNPDSELLPVARSNGILVALTAPRGGLISGTGALLELDGWTWEEMTLKAPVALFVEWPGMTLDRTPGNKVPLEKQERARDERIQKIRETFETARAYARGQEPSGLPKKDRDVKWDAMIRAARREIPVVVHASSLLEIKAALKLVADLNLRMILEGGQDAWRVADELKRLKVPVLVGNVMDVGRSWEPYDVNFTTPLKLQQAGVEYCITHGGGFEAANARNLPYTAAKAVAYGLPAEEALRAITLYPARILGVGDRLGSIEVGKDATLIVTDGDPLDIRVNVQRAFIRGRELDLSDRHKRLYERYRLKPRRAR